MRVHRYIRERATWFDRLCCRFVGHSSVRLNRRFPPIRGADDETEIVVPFCARCGVAVGDGEEWQWADESEIWRRVR